MDYASYPDYLEDSKREDGPKSNEDILYENPYIDIQHNSFIALVY